MENWDQNGVVSSARMGRRDLLAAGAGLAVAMATSSVFAQTGRPGVFDWTLHSPEEAGMTRAGLEGVKAAIQKHIDNGDLSGAVTAIARRNKLVFYEAQGLRDVEARAPMRTDDIFRMASSTKPTIAVAVLMLQEEGKLSIDDKVSRFIPEFRDTKVAVAADGAAIPRDPGVTGAFVDGQVKLVPADRDITIKDLLTHTAGLSTGGLGQMMSQIRHLPGETLATYVPRLGAAALDFQPGTRWQYSATDGFDVLLRIVEIASKTPGDVFMRERIHEPLDMRDTYFNLPPEKYGRLVKLYGRENGEWRPTAAHFGNGPTKYIAGSSGTMSTAHDYIQFEQMLLNRGELNGKRLLRPESVRLMSANHTGNLYHGIGNYDGGTTGTGFGLAVRVLRDPAGANSGRRSGAFGWVGALGTTTWTDPADEMTVALLVQQQVRSVLPDVEHAIRRAVVS